MKSVRDCEYIETIIIGGGQAGLSAGYHLGRHGLPFEILDAHERVGDAWRERWDSLRLFTPARYNGLDGMRFPAPGEYFPTKGEMADYLGAYAERFGLPVRNNVQVERLSRQGAQFIVEARDRQFLAENVIVAMAPFQKARVPSFAGRLDPAMVQLHSSSYCNSSQLHVGPVLVVGAGNSGAEIALELAGEHKVFLAGEHPGSVPFRIETRAARLFFRIFLRVFLHRVATIRTPIGKKLRQKFIHHGGPLVRAKPADLEAAGIERVGRVAEVRDGWPVLRDGRALNIANVVWCTGFEPGFSWIDLPVLDSYGWPRQRRGVVSEEPGLFFLGLPFIYAASSVMPHGLGRDAAYIAGVVAARVRRGARAGRMQPRPRPA